MNLKKNGFSRPIFMIKPSGFQVSVNVLKYPKLFSRLLAMSKRETKEAKEHMTSMLETELQRLEERI